MKVLYDEIIYKSRYIEVIGRHFLDNTGKECVYEVIKQRGDASQMLALTHLGDILLISQQRLCLEGMTLELPGGISTGENDLEVAISELKSETGYVPVGVPIWLGRVPCDVGRLQNETHLYFCKALYNGAQTLEDSEYIDDVLSISVDDLIPFLSNKPRVDSRIFAAYALAKQKGLI